MSTYFDLWLTMKKSFCIINKATRNRRFIKMKTASKITTRYLILCAFFTALTAVCSQILIPIPFVPISLALFAVHLTGALLGPKYGSLSMVAYALLGAVGAPVFAGFTGGLGILMGNNGGYIFGYIFCAFIVGILCEKWGNTFPKMCLAMALGVIACYVFGTIWFMIITKNALWQSLIYCVFPFLIGDILKIILAALLAKALRKPLAKGGWVNG